jgi:hypothetical protein
VADETATTVKMPEPYAVPWPVIFSVSMGSLRRRMARAFVAMIGVILAISFLAYMLVNSAMIQSLIAASIHNDELRSSLQKAGIDPIGGGGTNSRMIILISLSLLTCLVGIVNAMLMAVTERVREIGTLKCLGALNSFIVKTFFIESILQGVAATILGIVLGIAFGLISATVSFGGYAWSECPWLSVCGSALFAFAVGSIISVVASIAPAWWAAQKQPVEALRVEE